MTEHALNMDDVDAGAHEQGGEGVAQGMGRHGGRIKLCQGGEALDRDVDRIGGDRVHPYGREDPSS